MRIADEQLGDSAHSFIQALIKVTDVSFCGNVIRSNVSEDFAMMETAVPEKLVFV